LQRSWVRGTRLSSDRRLIEALATRHTEGARRIRMGPIVSLVNDEDSQACQEKARWSQRAQHLRVSPQRILQNWAQREEAARGAAECLRQLRFPTRASAATTSRNLRLQYRIPPQMQTSSTAMPPLAAHLRCHPPKPASTPPTSDQPRLPKEWAASFRAP